MIWTRKEFEQKPAEIAEGIVFTASGGKKHLFFALLACFCSEFFLLFRLDWLKGDRNVLGSFSSVPNETHETNP